MPAIAIRAATRGHHGLPPRPCPNAGLPSNGRHPAGNIARLPRVTHAPYHRPWMNLARTICILPTIARAVRAFPFALTWPRARAMPVRNRASKHRPVVREPATARLHASLMRATVGQMRIPSGSVMPPRLIQLTECRSRSALAGVHRTGNARTPPRSRALPRSPHIGRSARINGSGKSPGSCRASPRPVTAHTTLTRAAYHPRRIARPLLRRVIRSPARMARHPASVAMRPALMAKRHSRRTPGSLPRLPSVRWRAQWKMRRRPRCVLPARCRQRVWGRIGGQTGVHIVPPLPPRHPLRRRAVSVAPSDQHGAVASPRQASMGWASTILPVHSPPFRGGRHSLFRLSHL